jgi:hypothetical protein
MGLADPAGASSPVRQVHGAKGSRSTSPDAAEVPKFVR